MRKRKYLDDINITDRPDTWNPDDKRQKEWKKQRKKYGFDERETWSMDLTWHLWLYEHLRAFKDWAVDIDYVANTLTYKEKEYSLGELIDMILERLEYKLKNDWECTTDKNKRDYVHEIEEIWCVICDTMWW